MAQGLRVRRLGSSQAYSVELRRELSNDRELGLRNSRSDKTREESRISVRSTGPGHGVVRIVIVIVVVMAGKLVVGMMTVDVGVLVD